MTEMFFPGIMKQPHRMNTLNEQQSEPVLSTLQYETMKQKILYIQIIP